MPVYHRMEILLQTTITSVKVQTKCFSLLLNLKGTAKIRKIAIYRVLISLLVPELQQFKNE